MAKDPAFLFYPGDWLGGTQYLTMEQKGCYMELLVLQFNTGGFTETQAKQVLSICFDVAWPMLKQKFTKEGDLYKNMRLEQEIIKRKNFSESRRINGLSPKNKQKAYAKHMENENENENKRKRVREKEKEKPLKTQFVPPTEQQVRDYFKENGYSESVGSTAYKYYSQADWSDSNGKKVRSWKQKMMIWFKPENKSPEQKAEAAKPDYSKMREFYGDDESN